MNVQLPVLLGIVSIVHLFCCYFQIKKIQRATKVFLMPLLLTIYLDLTSNKSKDDFPQRSNLIINGIIMGFSGDTLLLFHKPKIFLMGLGCFLIGHILYMIEMLSRVEQFENVYVFMILFLITNIIYYFLFTRKLVYGFKGEMFGGGLVYGITLCFLSSIAGYLFFNYRTLGHLLAFIGSAFFCLSDSILAVHAFVNPIYKGDFLVMSTYILAETLIGVGLAI